jgi:hypothetical protein
MRDMRRVWHFRTVFLPIQQDFLSTVTKSAQI